MKNAENNERFISMCIMLYDEHSIPLAIPERILHLQIRRKISYKLSNMYILMILPFPLLGGRQCSLQVFINLPSVHQVSIMF